MAGRGYTSAIMISTAVAMFPAALAWPVAATAQYTAGGFGNGNPRMVPAFQQAVANTRTLFRLQVPTDTGGMSDLIEILLSANLRDGTQQMSSETSKQVQNGALSALKHPSASPSRLYSVRRAYALVGHERRVVILVCDCGTSTLAMRDDDGSVVLSPQLDSRELGVDGL